MILCNETSRKFLKDKGATQTCRFTSIEDSAAKTLAQFTGYLNLSRLKSLSDAAAQAVVKLSKVLSDFGRCL